MGHQSEIMEKGGPRNVGSKLPIKPTRASRAGMNYKAANGTSIRNYGERRLEGWTQKGKKTGITIQVAEVNKVLGSVGKMTEAGNTIIFSNGKSIITSDPDGSVAAAAFKAAKAEQTTELRKDNGVYTFDMWLPRQPGGGNYQEECNQGHYDCNEGVDYQNIGHISDFQWLDEAM